MTTQENTNGLLSSDRASEATTETTTTTEATSETKDKAKGADETATAETATETKDKTKSTPAEDDTEAAEDAETDKDNKDKAKPESEGAPETYQLEAPEGVEIDMEGDAAKAFTDLCRAQNRTQEEAQAFFGMFANEILAIRNAQNEAWDQESNVDWVKAVAADKLVGGTKEQIAENLGVAKRALDKYGDPELDALMSRFRLGNHPAVIRFMHRVGATLQEDKSIHRGAADEPVKSNAEVFYGT